MVALVPDHADPELTLSSKQYRLLHRWARDETAPRRQHRAVIVLTYDQQGLTVAETAEAIGVSPRTVRMWLQRVQRSGPDGLADRPRTGAPVSVPAATTREVLERPILEAPPRGRRWSQRQAADAARGISPATVGRVWREHGMDPGAETWRLADDSGFPDRVDTVGGVCVAPGMAAFTVWAYRRARAERGRQAEPAPISDVNAGSGDHADVLSGLSQAREGVDQSPSRRHRGTLASLVTSAPEHRVVHLVVHAAAGWRETIASVADLHQRVRVHLVPTSAVWHRLAQRWLPVLADATQDQLRSTVTYWASLPARTACGMWSSRPSSTQERAQPSALAPVDAARIRTRLVAACPESIRDTLPSGTLGMLSALRPRAGEADLTAADAQAVLMLCADLSVRLARVEARLLDVGIQPGVWLDAATLGGPLGIATRQGLQDRRRSRDGGVVGVPLCRAESSVSVERIVDTIVTRREDCAADLPRVQINSDDPVEVAEAVVATHRSVPVHTLRDMLRADVVDALQLVAGAREQLLRLRRSFTRLGRRLGLSHRECAAPFGTSDRRAAWATHRRLDALFSEYGTYVSGQEATELLGRDSDHSGTGHAMAAQEFASALLEREDALLSGDSELEVWLDMLREQHDAGLIAKGKTALVRHLITELDGHPLQGDEAFAELMRQGVALRQQLR